MILYISCYRPIMSTSSSSSSLSGFQQEGELFSRLESQSILYMLHQSNSLSSSDPKEIMELLKMSPSIDEYVFVLKIELTDTYIQVLVTVSLSYTLMESSSTLVFLNMVEKLFYFPICVSLTGDEHVFT